MAPSNKPALSDGDRTVTAPPGLYILSACFFLGVAALFYYAVSSPDYRVFAVIYAPFLLYAGAGLVPRWKGARILAIVLVSLSLALAILDVIAFVALDMADEQGAAAVLALVMASGFRIMVLPFILIFLLGKRVTAYFAEST
ncbi:MAG: hypothetical protein QNI99_09290 [Woeseiaceae bacterium]|nr:hypothetical protein [Woeseiaceae bacterium]